MTRKTIAHVTDSHLGQRLVMGGAMGGGRLRYDDAPDEHRDRLRRVLDDVARRGIPEVVFGGDIGARSSVPGFFNLLKSYDFATTILLGNHDTYEAVVPYCGGAVGAVDGKLCFSLDDATLKRIFLDSSDNSIGGDQRAWLARELTGSGPILLFVHHPVLAIDTPIDGAGAALRDRDDVKAVLMRSGREITVFCGHYHMADAASEANIRQFATPATSYQIIKQSNDIRVDRRSFGYRILTIDGPTIQTDVVMLAETP